MSRSLKVLLPSVSVFSMGLGIWIGGKLDRASDGSNVHGNWRMRLSSAISSATTVTIPPEKPDVGETALVSKEVGVPKGKASEIMKHGFPSLDNLATFEDFVISYDRRNRTANWVFEHLTREKVRPVEGVSREQSQFREDERQHRSFRSKNEDYFRSGYDRGHLAAAANHRWSQKAMDETFILSNIAPQVGKGFNRDGWSQLEKFIRHLTKKYTNVYVCTGPLYLPRRETDGKLYVRYEVVGKNHVAVPTHFFKVAACEDTSGSFDILSFVMPNQALPGLDDGQLKNYLVPVESIERASGLLLFANLPKDRIKRLNGKSV